MGEALRMKMKQSKKTKRGEMDEDEADSVDCYTRQAAVTCEGDLLYCIYCDRQLDYERL